MLFSKKDTKASKKAGNLAAVKRECYTIKEEKENGAVFLKPPLMRRRYHANLSYMWPHSGG